jgi:hypothetical protein
MLGDEYIQLNIKARPFAGSLDEVDHSLQYNFLYS